MLKAHPTQVRRVLLSGVVSVVQGAWRLANDLYLRINTEHQCSGDDGAFASSDWIPRHNDSVAYQGADYRNLRRVIRELRLSSRDVFFDIGCGKGRVICLVARERLRKVVGIELSPALCEVARQNARRVRGRQTPIEVRCGDAAAGDYSEGNIFFLYNPFGPDTLRDVLGNLRTSVTAVPRKLTIVYYNSVYSEVLDSSTWLQKVREFRTLTGRPIGFWHSVA